MEIHVIEEEGRRGIEVTVRSAPGDCRAARIVDRLRMSEGRLLGYPSETSPERRLVALADVAGVETSGEHATIHLLDGSRLESPMRLFEVEALLEGTEFVRVSRQELVNFDHVVSIRPEFGSRLVLGLADGREALVTRSYAPGIKSRIGISR